MWGQCCCLEVWEDLSYSCQLFFSKGSGELILVGDVGSDVLLGTKLLCLIVCNELGVQLGPEDMLGGSEVVRVDIRHGKSMSVGDSTGGRNDGILARRSPPYMCVGDSL